MGTLAEAFVSALRGFANEVGTWTNQGSLVSIESHIAQIESAAAQDVHAGETAAKAVLADLYGAFHGHTPADAEPAAAPVEVSTAPAAPLAPATGGPVEGGTTVLVGESGPETVVPSTPATVDPTPAPSTTEASSAPSSTPSASTTDTAATAAPATDAAPAVAS